MAPRTAYAADTSVSVEKSQAEIAAHVRRYGGRQFLLAYDEGDVDARAVVGFVIGGRQVRFVLPLPDRDDPRFTLTPSAGRTRSDSAAEAAWEQGCRAAWRSLGLVIRAKLEAVASGIVTFDQEFLAHLVLPEGDTLGERLHPVLAATFAEGRSAPGLLPGDPLPERKAIGS